MHNLFTIIANIRGGVLKSSETFNNHGHNIVRIFDVLANFPFTNEAWLLVINWYIRVASRVAELLKTQDLRKLEKFRIMSKLHGITT